MITDWAEKDFVVIEFSQSKMMMFILKDAENNNVNIKHSRSQV